MLRAILRNVQQTLLLSSLLLVLLAFQRLNSFDTLRFATRHNTHQSSHSDDSSNEGPSVRVGPHHHMIFSKEFRVGLFRFVLPSVEADRDGGAAVAEEQDYGKNSAGSVDGGGKTMERYERKKRGRAGQKKNDSSLANKNDATQRPSITVTKIPTNPQHPKGTIAYAISVPTCPPLLNLTESTAVLRHSIELLSHPNKNAEGRSSSYGYKMYAFLSPETVDCAKGPLGRLGYTVVILEDLFLGAGKGKSTRTLSGVDTPNKCNGAWVEKVLPLYSYNLVDHPVVVHLDWQSIILKPLDVLFDAIIDGKQQQQPPKEGRRITKPKTIHEKAKRTEAFFKRDHGGNLPPHTTAMDRNIVSSSGMAASGDVFVIRPSRSSYEELRSMALELCQQQKSSKNITSPVGTFSPSNSNVVGTLLSRYYDERHPGISEELDPCLYHPSSQSSPSAEVMIGSKDGRRGGGGGGGDANMIPERDQCDGVSLSEVRTVSLTSCQSLPWDCVVSDDDNGKGGRGGGRWCWEATREWYKLRRSLEVTREGKMTTHGAGGDIEKRDLISSASFALEKGTREDEWFGNYCTRTGPGGTFR